MKAVLDNGVASIADGIMERWFSPGFRAGRTEELAGWRNMFLRCDARGYAATCATLRDSDLRDRIGAIALPTLFVAGEQDLAMPVAQVEATAAAIAGARFEVFPGTGHIPSIEAPEKLAGLMLGFFKEAGHG
ncbi:MAG: hypothetical protein EOP21_08790 [Hyphomicrobiales bacterium]|nr:MAG: hypothetical protein EOP21_08790 [Hyphomicrobiales bacterium]